jgi:transposase
MKTELSLHVVFDMIWAVKAVAFMEHRFRPTNEPSYLSQTCRRRRTRMENCPTRIQSSAHIRTASCMEKELDKGGGLDIHKKSVKAAIESEDGSILEAEFGMTVLQLCNLKKWLLDNGCKRVIVESTASYWYRIDQVLSDEIRVIVVNPLDVKSSSGKKTDKIDARRMASRCLSMYEVNPSRKFSKEELDLKRLTRARQQYVQIRTKLKNQIHKILDAAGIALSLFVSDIFGKSGMHLLRGLVARKSLEELVPGIPSNRIRRRARELPELIPVQLNDVQIMLLQRALSTMDNVQKSIQEIDAVLYKKAESCKADLQILMSVPGVKFVAAMTILAEIGNYKDFADGDQLACYSGLTPFVDDSGEKHKLGRITKHGSKHLRWILNQVAHAASKTKNSRLRRFYFRLMHRKGEAKAITALSRKILSIIHHLLVNQEMWKEDGFKKSRLDFRFDRTSSSSTQLTWLDLLFRNVGATEKAKPGRGG